MTARARGVPFLLLGICLAMSACRASEQPESIRRLPIPSKDEVALVDGRPLSLSGFVNLRTLLKDPSIENTFWVGIASLTIQNNAISRNINLPMESAVVLARYAAQDLPLEDCAGALRAFLGPQGELPGQVAWKNQVERWVAQSVVQRNPQVLAQLH